MEINDIMRVLEEDMGAVVISTVDGAGRPHGRYINIGLANEEGVFFMTSQETDFYQQLMANPHIAITGMKEEGYLIQVIRIDGVVRPLGREKLTEVLADNPYVHLVYPNEDDQTKVQVFQLYKGHGFYHSMTQGHKYVFEI